ncbi:uncharacterized protein LOC127475722 [Manacus candei]|uniref:uncharacterized protein LOC127475722 n=1 Tax=Manacus candei TaxID=415023 RepID=UPI00222775D1|nr:uncharacterized protein LOC127475722 [Manacus candei]
MLSGLRRRLPPPRKRPTLADPTEIGPGVTKLMEEKTKGLEAPSFPSVAVGVPDASGRTNPVAFMSSVLCCVCLQGKTFWLPLSLRSPWVCRTPLAGLTLWLLCPTCCAVCACREPLPSTELASALAVPFPAEPKRREVGWDKGIGSHEAEDQSGLCTGDDFHFRTGKGTFVPTPGKLGQSNICLLLAGVPVGSGLSVHGPGIMARVLQTWGTVAFTPSLQPVQARMLPIGP